MKINLSFVYGEKYVILEIPFSLITFDERSHCLVTESAVYSYLCF
jgi:hypothetical protein